jgi:hypothetical protein
MTPHVPAADAALKSLPPEGGAGEPGHGTDAGTAETHVPVPAGETGVGERPNRAIKAWRIALLPLL